MRIIGTIVGVVVVLALSACGGGDGAPSAEATADGTVIPAAVVEAMAVSQGEFFIGLSVDGQAEEKIEPTLNADRTRFSFTRELQAGNHRFAINYYLRVQDPASPGEVLDIAVHRYETSGDFVLLAGTDDALDIGSVRMPLTEEQDGDGDGVANLDELREGVYFRGNNANLSTLGIEGDAGLVEPFEVDRLSYTARLPSTQTSLAVASAVSEAGATVTIVVNGTVPPGSSAPINPGNNTVSVIVTSEDGHTEKNYAIIANRNQAPSFTGDGAISLAENTATVDIAAVDPDGDALAIRVTGGADQDKFSTDPTIGAALLRFKSAPDFEVPLDANADNTYEVDVEVDDGRGEVAEQTKTVAVTNVNRLKVAVSYPPAGGNLGGKVSQSTVTGNILDEEDGIVVPADVKSLTVDNVSKEGREIEVIEDGRKPARWSVQVPVGWPVHTLNVSLESSDGDVDGVEQKVINQAPMVEPGAIDITSDGKRALLLEGGSGAPLSVIAVDLTDNFRSSLAVLMTDDTVDVRPLSISTYGGANEKALAIAEGGYGSTFFYVVDLKDGGVSRFAWDWSIPAIGIQAVTLNTENGHLLVTRDSSTIDGSSVIDVDPVAGTAIEVSGGSPSRGGGLDLINPVGITLDTTATPPRALVVDSVLNAVIAVNLEDGNRDPLSGQGAGIGENFSKPVAITLDTTSTPPRALVLDSVQNAVVAVNLMDGERQIISGEAAGQDPLFSDLAGITLDTTTTPPRALVLDGQSGLIAVDLDQIGNRTVLSDPGVGTGPALTNPSKLALDPDNNRAFVLANGTLSEIDLATGDRTSLSADAFNFTSPVDITLGPVEQSLFVLDGETPLPATVYEVNLADRSQRDFLFGNTAPEASLDIVSPAGILLDKIGSRVLVDDATNGLIGINLDTKQREILFSPSSYGYRDIELDTDAGQALLLEDTNTITTLDLLTLVSANYFQPQIVFWDHISGDVANNGVLVFSNGDLRRLIEPALFRLRLDTEAVETVSDNLVASGPNIINVTDIALDADNRRLLLLDDQLDAILVIELGSGERAILSQ